MTLKEVLNDFEESKFCELLKGENIVGPCMAQVSTENFQNIWDIFLLSSHIGGQHISVTSSVWKAWTVEHFLFIPRECIASCEVLDAVFYLEEKKDVSYISL